MMRLGLGLGLGSPGRPSAAAPAPAGPTDLLVGLNGDFSSAGPPPELATPSGTATLVISGGKLVYTGGTGGSFMAAAWTGINPVSGGSYRIEYEASGQALGCAPRFNLGAAGNVTGSGSTGSQVVMATAGSGADFAITFSPNSTGRNLSLDNLHMYRALSALGLGPDFVTENSAPGTSVGAITGASQGSSIELTDDAGGLFAIESGAIVTAGALDYETAASHQIELTETLAGAYGSPKVSTITVQVQDVAPTLSLTSSPPPPLFVDSTAPTGYLVGGLDTVTSGSTLTMLDSAGGRFALDGEGIVTAADLSGDVGTSVFITVRETHPEATNSPFDLVAQIDIAAA